MRHQSPDICFDVPEHWVNRTLVAFSAPTDQPGAPNVVLTRDVLSQQDSVEEYADRQLHMLTMPLEGYRLHFKRHRQVDGAEAIDMRYSWSAGSERALQRQLVIRGAGDEVVCMTVTSAESAADRLEPIVERIVGSIRFRGTT